MNVRRYADQEILFSRVPERLAVASVEVERRDDFGEITVNVWRNHAIESIKGLMAPFAAFGGYRLDWRLGPYDDSLSYVGHQNADLEIVWLDRDRYLDMKVPEFDRWFRLRVVELRRMTRSPVLIVNCTAEETLLPPDISGLAGTYFTDLSVLANEHGIPVKDERAASVAGSSLNPRLHTLIARELACRLIPAATLPPVKAIALDLDYTLHEGVLAEDGPDGVVLTDGHRELQAYLHKLCKRGVLLALISKNEPSDVEQLFLKREDYPLKWEDLAAREISWQEKAGALERIAKQFRVGLDAIIFVDDNPGELAAVAGQLPEVGTVWASPEATETRRAIELYPGLWRWEVLKESELRLPDLRANAERKKIQVEALDRLEYLKQLEVTLRIEVDSQSLRTRAADLCRKTNQFNMALARTEEMEIERRMSSPDSCVVTVELSDRLSRSGVIAVVIAVVEAEALLIEELCISCRALGRSLEEDIIMQAIQAMPALSRCVEVVFSTRHGPRNEPALAWLAGALGKELPLEEMTYSISSRRVLEYVPTEGIETERG